jgi:hypothetical protein
VVGMRSCIMELSTSQLSTQHSSHSSHSLTSNFEYVIELNRTSLTGFQASFIA